MLIMAEVTAEMGAELRASAMAAGTSIAAEVGRRLERLQRVEAEDSGVPGKEGTRWPPLSVDSIAMSMAGKKAANRGR